MYKVYNWQDIQTIFQNSNLLLGNGASIAVHKEFNYKSLLDKSNFLEDEKKLFDYYETSNFELILKIIWQTNNVNKILDIEDTKTKEAYERIRNSLIKAVKNVHPEYINIINDIQYISNFLQNFRYVVSLNYDLIVYWSMLYDNKKTELHEFRDFFYNRNIDGKLSFNDDNIHLSYDGTKVFYPHGNLILALDKLSNEIKLRTKSDGLISSITEKWESGDYIPLFISESDSKQKLEAIKKSNYLNTIYRRILPYLGSCTNLSMSSLIEASYNINEGECRSSKYATSFVVYGFGFTEQDKHIVDRIFQEMPLYNINCVAISVFNSDEVYCQKVIQTLEKYKKRFKIYFFDSQSAGCWNNPI